MAERSLKLLIAGDATGALKALGQTGDATDGIGQKFVKFGKWAAAGFAAAGAAAAVFAKGAIDAAVESQKITKVTEQIIKSTQGAAKISAEEVSKLATALSNKTGIDDEAIQSAQNLILTFKNVRNEVGKGNDIFNRASALALDLSTVMGNDASGAAMQLAKALDNPVKGVTALTRSGVSFTAQQKEQIKTLVESGKTLEAQKIILKEVESQVGGTAAAQATAADRAKVAFGNLQEQIGMYLLPVVEKVSNYLVTTFIPKLSELADKYGPAVGAAFQRLGEVMKAVWGWLEVNVPIIFEKVKTTVSGFITAITGFWNKHKEDIVRIVTILWETLKGVIDANIRIVKGIIDVFLGIFKGDWDRVWNGLKDVVVAAWDGMVAVIKGFGKILWEAAKFAFDKVKDGFVAGWEAGINFVKSIPGKLTTALKDAATWLLDIGGDIIDGLWEGIKRKSGEFAGKIGKWIKDHIPGPVRAIMGIHSPSTVMAEIGGDIADGLILGMTEKSDAVTAASAAMVSAVTGPMAGEAARNGGKQLALTMFAAMASEAARNGTAVYTPLIAVGAGEMARNGNKVAKPLFAAMAGEAAREGAAQVAGALRTHLMVEARNLGYDLGNVLSEEITGSLEDVIGKMTAKIGMNIGGAVSGVGGGDFPTAGAAGGGAPININDLYGRFTSNMGEWARNQLAELADWNRKWNPDPNTPQVRVFAPNPLTGGTLTDTAGNGIYLDDTNAVREALGRLVPQMATGGVVSSPTLAMIGERGPEAVVPLNRAGGYGMGDVYVNVTGSVISERDLVDSIRKALILDQQRGKILIPTY